MEIFVKVPLRISFVGGGSDIAQYYTFSAGAVISTTISHFIEIHITLLEETSNNIFHININGEEQYTDSVNKIDNEYLKTTLKFLGIKIPFKVSSTSTIAAGSGLGSSSAFLVGILHGFHAFKNDNIKDKFQLAEEAYYIEKVLLNKSVGKQDHYIAAFGGFKNIIFHSDESVTVKSITVNKKLRSFIEDNLLLLSLATTRNANSILINIEKKPSMAQRNIMKEITSLCGEFLTSLYNHNIIEIGSLLDRNWNLKKQLHRSVSNNNIDNLYYIAKKKGALGGKVLGAGGGGYLLLCCLPEQCGYLLKNIGDFESLPIKLWKKGSTLKIKYNE